MTRAHALATIDATRELGAPLVVLSSHDVYGQFGRLNGHAAPEPEEIVTEDSPLTVPSPFRAIGDHPDGPDYDKKEVEAVLNVGEAETPTMAERIEDFASHLGVTISWTSADVTPPEGFDWLRGMPNDVVVSSARIRRDLGYSEITTSSERIDDTVRWRRSLRGHQCRAHTTAWTCCHALRS